MIDAGGTTAIPGLIDSHVHTTFGDYTPRQKTVGFLESYVHGGVTTAISACEVHVPGRPTDPAGVKALAVAAFKSFENFRPGGMRVHGGSMILEPGLREADFREVAATRRVAGEGRIRRGQDAVRLCADDRLGESRGNDHDVPYGRLVHSRLAAQFAPSTWWRCSRTCRSTSTAGPTALPDEDYRVIIEKTGCRAAGVHGRQSAHDACCARIWRTRLGVFDRFIIATDTPTGSGVMPLGMLYTIAHCASLTKLPAEWFVCAATGSNARVYRLNSGLLERRA